MKLKELLANRYRLERYDELKEWKEFLCDDSASSFTINKYRAVLAETQKLSDYIKKIIVDALEAEIQKLDEE